MYGSSVDVDDTAKCDSSNHSWALIHEAIHSFVHKALAHAI